MVQYQRFDEGSSTKKRLHLITVFLRFLHSYFTYYTNAKIKNIQALLEI